MQLEWARHIAEKCLIIAPLSVARQTVRIGAEFGYKVVYAREQKQAIGQLAITNYEMIEHFQPSAFDAVVLDESSILKALDGKARKRLTQMFHKTPKRLCCSATPAPNDQSEIGNHAEFLGVCTMPEMLAMFFVHDEDGWRLKGHARQAYYDWLCSWAMAIRKPSDLGYEDDGYILPALQTEVHWVKAKAPVAGQMFATGLHGIGDRARVRKATCAERVSAALELIGADSAQWIIWCGLNTESTQFAQAAENAREVSGNDSAEDKASALEAFQDNKFRVLVTKTKIAGFGMNFQNAHKMLFLGLNDSWEAYYQAVRRCWRFGQTKPVEVHVVLSDHEAEIWENVQAKDKEAQAMSDALIARVAEREKLALGGSDVPSEAIRRDVAAGKNWTAHLGDSCDVLREIETASVHLSVYSPPFASLFTYSNLPNDLGNCHEWDTFFKHYRFIIRELLRVTLPGRNTCVHSADIPLILAKDGEIGLRDFPGKIIEAYQAEGWTFHGRVTIDKDPQAQAIRTHSKALLFVQMEKDSSWSRPAIGDFVLIFRKPGENLVPIRPRENQEITRDLWIEWARPVWYGIRESDTLQYTTANDPEDERHICPLQLGVVERCIKLWSNPGEMVLTPFGGIGTEAYQAVKYGRKATLIELKPSYWRIACENLRKAENDMGHGQLFA